MTFRLLGIPDELRLEIEQNGGGTTEAARLIIEHAVNEAQSQNDLAIKEVQSIIGPHGSLTRVQAGGLRITPGDGMGVFADGVHKTQIQPNGTLVIGSDIEDPSTTTEIFFVEDTIYNSEEFGAGDFLIGDNSEDTGNVKWDASEGQWQFRSGTTVTAFMDTDGSVTAGGGDITMDADGLWVTNQQAAFGFEDTNGDRFKIYILSDSADNLVLKNKVGEVIMEVDSSVGEVLSLEFGEAENDANVASLRIRNTEVASTAALLSLDAGVVIWAGIDGKETVFNENSFDINFRIESAANTHAFYLDGAGEFIQFFGGTAAAFDNGNSLVSFGGVFVVDYGAEKRLEIGSDHYFPTRDSSNPNGFWNEANQDMDFTFEGTSDASLLKVDAGLNAVGFGGAAESGYKVKVTGKLKVTEGLLAETNANDIYRCDSPGGTSLFTATINGAPSGTSVVYNAPSAGTEAAIVPVSTSQLAKLRLYNTTRSNSALISNVNTGTNTITLTATVPANWASGDTITIVSQTVSGGSSDWIDLEITSGPTGRTDMLFKTQITSTTVGNVLRIHPFESFAASKLDNTVVQVASNPMTGFAVPKIIGNVFSIAWTGSPASVIIREAGYLQ